MKLWRLWRWGPPLPIPNREVKPTRADGTAVKCGRVGRRRLIVTLKRTKFCFRVFLCPDKSEIEIRESRIAIFDLRGPEFKKDCYCIK